MSVWRPAGGIRVKVIGLVIHAGRLLAAEVTADDGRVKGVRPLGGSVMFGETREAALRREFREEVGCEIAIAGEWLVFDNIYEHEGTAGHEVVFAAPVDLLDRGLYRRPEMHLREDDGTPFRAAWFAPAELAAAGIALYPEGLEAVLPETPC
ncbi:NUDIX hydrolase [Acuticoccus mangrovi]|uniref:NUDIX domain-containing protein n=1 Tax=Acuticoccus mangrovi TaxID=2796142 RepID=A0A934MLD3_9HYPH|nr:NUDIX domain-containing protein [Acuticoccus mangrovi]MBJ3776264.1 NUDIX domain-containing protein [Acuticoccus mangrovi]